MPINCFSGTVRDNRSLLKRAEVVSIGSLSFVCVKKWANITYLLLRLFFQLYLNTCARAILFCACALFVNLIDMCI